MAHLENDQVGAWLVVVTSVYVRLIEARDDIGLPFAALWPEQLGVGDHTFLTYLIGHEVGDARGRVRLDVEVDALIVQVLVEVECQGLLALMCVVPDRLAKPLCMKPLTTMLVAAQEIEDRLLVVEVLVNVLVERFEEDIPDLLKAFVCITACVIMQCDVQNQVFVGFLCDLLEEMVAYCCRFGFG